MKILVDNMPTEPSECPYAIKYDPNNCFCNYRKTDIMPRCNLNNGVCEWFKERRE